MAIVQISEDFAADASARVFAENPIHSYPLLPPGDLASSIRLGERLSCPLMVRLYQTVQEHEDAIFRATYAWDDLPQELFVEEPERFRMAYQLAYSGWFRRMSEVLASGVAVDTLLYELLSDVALTQRPDYRQFWLPGLPKFDRSIPLTVHGSDEEDGYQFRSRPRPRTGHEVYRQVRAQFVKSNA